MLKYNNTKNERVTTAVLLAAGTGNRLFPLTQDAPKCLTLVNGISILERQISNLSQHGFKRLVVVTGYLEDQIRDFLGTQAGGMSIDYIFSPLYEETNNIYSLWMAREIINEPFLLLESDLVFDASHLNDMLCPDKIAVAKIQPWMNGTCVTIGPEKWVSAFTSDDVDTFGEIKFKTVNIYSISLISWRRIVKRLDKYILHGKVNSYYETVFAEMTTDGSIAFRSVLFGEKPWYEIDTIDDLKEAEKRFSSDNHTLIEAHTHAHLILK